MTAALGQPTTHQPLTARPYTSLPRISGTERALLFTVAVYVSMCKISGKYYFSCSLAIEERRLSKPDQVCNLSRGEPRTKLGFPTDSLMV